MSIRISKKKRPASVKVLGIGPEPVDLDFRELSDSHLLRAFSWYNYAQGTKEARHYLEKTYKNINWEEVPTTRQFLTYAWILKMIKNGCSFPSSIRKDMTKHFSELEQDFPKQKRIQKEAVKETPKFVDKKYLADLDEIEDFIYDGGVLAEADQKFKTLISTLPKYAVQEIRDNIHVRLEELKSKDKDVKEAYSHLSLKVKKSWIQFFSGWLKHIDFLDSAKKILKPRKVRIVPVEKKLKNLKFKKIDPELSLASINPEKLFGSKILWTFNTKYRELTRFESSEGFELKGTTLQNVISSQKKKIRKPEQVQTFFSNTQKRMDKEFSMIRTKESVHNCRLNEDTLIMKAF